MSTRALAALALALLVSPVAARDGSTVRGPAYVRDADTVVVGGTTVVRLKGVDADELRTPRGRHARQVMINIIDGQDLVCMLTAERTHGREVGYCTTAGGVDINREI